MSEEDKVAMLNGDSDTLLLTRGDTFKLVSGDGGSVEVRLRTHSSVTAWGKCTSTSSGTCNFREMPPGADMATWMEESRQTSKICINSDNFGACEFSYDHSRHIVSIRGERGFDVRRLDDVQAVVFLGRAPHTTEIKF